MKILIPCTGNSCCRQMARCFPGSFDSDIFRHQGHYQFKTVMIDAGATFAVIFAGGIVKVRLFS